MDNSIRVEDIYKQCKLLESSTEKVAEIFDELAIDGKL